MDVLVNTFLSCQKCLFVPLRSPCMKHILRQSDILKIVSFLAHCQMRRSMIISSMYFKYKNMDVGSLLTYYL